MRAATNSILKMLSVVSSEIAITQEHSIRRRPIKWTCAHKPVGAALHLSQRNPHATGLVLAFRRPDRRRGSTPQQRKFAAAVCA